MGGRGRGGRGWRGRGARRKKRKRRAGGRSGGTRGSGLGLLGLVPLALAFLERRRRRIAVARRAGTENVRQETINTGSLSLTIGKRRRFCR